MSSSRAAARAATPKTTSLATLSPARAEASRKNGARSRGPKTAEGKARSSRNALRHGLRAEQHVVVEGESAEAFAAFEAALVDDLAPEGVLQTLLASRIARAAWRLERAERIEVELFTRLSDGDLGIALMRDGNGARAFDTLLRYRGTAQAEFSWALRLLKALQAEAPQEAARRYSEVPEHPALPPDSASHLSPELPNKPEGRGNPGESRCEPGRIPAAPGPAAIGAALAATRDGASTPEKQPDEPESRRNPPDSSRRAETGPSRPVASAGLPSQAAKPARASLRAGPALASRRPGRASAAAAGSRC